MKLAGTTLRGGRRHEVQIPISETYAGAEISIPALVWRARKDGPAVFVTGALHGDELNGTGIVHKLIRNPGFELKRGSLILIPVVNILGFERRARYLPDRRDLNRAFPGSPTGSQASRIANRFFETVVAVCDLGIDCHTGAAQRTNYPNVRGDLRDPEVLRLARAFGCELIINGKGPQGSLRRAATDAGCPTLLLEAGEILKVEPEVTRVGVRGVKNVLSALGMIDSPPVAPAYQLEIEKTQWLRSEWGGMLDFHKQSGARVDQGEPLATCLDLLGNSSGTIRAPAPGVILGMTTHPFVRPGDPVYHLALA